MVNSKTVIIAAGIILIVAGGVWVAGFSKKSATQTTSSTTTQTSSQNKQPVMASDACVQFTKEFVGQAVGREIFRTTKFNYGSHYGCEYFVSQTNVNQMFLIDIDQGSAQDQKSANDYLGFKTQKNDSIPMDNFIVWQNENVLNKLYLVIDPNNYLIINRSGADVLNDDKIVKLAIAISQELKKEGFIFSAAAGPTKSNTVPLPQETDIVHSFFNLIGEQRAADAVSMLAPDQVTSDSQKQAWAVMLNGFETVSITNIESSMPEEWTTDKHTYKVTMDVKMKPEAAKAAIPNYGYENGTNVRFISLEKVGNLWKIGGIATGP